MKQFLFLIPLMLSHSCFSQDEKTHGIYYKISLATTLAVNEDYQVFDEYDDTLLQPSALFVNNTLGYQMDHRTALGINVEYNWQHKQGLHFLPIFLNLRHNIIADDDNLFLRVGYGKLLSISRDFEKGTLYKLGIGYQIFDEDYRNSWLLGLDFSRKRFGIRETEKISSVAIFLEFMLF